MPFCILRRRIAFRALAKSTRHDAIFMALASFVLPSLAPIACEPFGQDGIALKCCFEVSSRRRSTADEHTTECKLFHGTLSERDFMKKCGWDSDGPFTAVSTHTNGISRISDNVPFFFSPSCAVPSHPRRVTLRLSFLPK